jgi:class 3 adenylate cyclase
VDIPETRYAKTSDGVHIAYQVLGNGPLDFIYVSPFFSHVEQRWGGPHYARYLRRIASFSRLIMFDKRGTGMSDPVPVEHPPDADTRMDDIRAVLDVVGSDRAIVYAASESGAIAMLFAATYPDRTLALVLHGTFPSLGPDVPWGYSVAEYEEHRAAIERAWGTEDYVRLVFPKMEPQLVRWFAAYMRHGMSPGSALTQFQLEWESDVRAILPTIHVPTLILHRAEDDPEANRYIAEHIPGAQYVALPGEEHIPYLADQRSVLDAIERFVLGVRDEETELNRVLATVLFTDIVGSTKRAAELGDRGWRDLVERHHATVRAMLARYRGTEVDTAGDGFFATFDGPARAVKCAKAVIEAVRPLGIEVRIGVHTGEVETIDGKVGGLGVVIGSRVGALAGASEVLVSQTVKDLVVGSGLVFEEAGEQELKGVPDRWRLYRVMGG